MFASLGSSWGPRALPGFLTDQLQAQGFSVEDSGRIARQINEKSGTATATSLFVELGSCKFLEGDIDGAIAAWRHAISSQDGAAASRGLLNLGLLYEHLHLHERALGLLAAVADRDVEPYVAPAAMASARCQLAIGQAEHAMETMARLAQRTMATDPDGPELIETLYGLGDVADQAGRLDRAERSWRVAAASPPSTMQQAATERLLQLLVDQGHDEEARDLLTRQSIAAKTATTPQAVLDRATALKRLGDTTEAATLIASVDSDTLRPTDRFRVAMLKIDCGQVNDAIDDLESLLADDDLEVQLRAAFSLGELYESYDMHDAAASMYERVADADHRYWPHKGSLALGDLLDATGDREAALAHWRRAGASEIQTIADLAQTRLASLPATDPGKASEPVVDLRDAVLDKAAAEVPPVSEPAASSEPQIISLNNLDDTEDIDKIDDGTGSDPVVAHAPPVAAAHASADKPAPASESASVDEPLVVVLSELEDDLDDPVDGIEGAVAATSANGSVRSRSAGSAFADHLDDTTAHNPYASLAPHGEATDVPATTRNPYAELAPNFDDVEFDPPPDVEPGDWESMLDDWSPSEAESATTPKQHSSAFSRYT